MTVQRSFLMDEENDFPMLEKALLAYASRCRNNAESTKQGYGTAKSIMKRHIFICEAEKAEALISRMAEIFN